MPDLDDLIKGVSRRDARSLGMLCRIIDDGCEGMNEALPRLYKMGGRARIIGITGPPGAGKSTVLNRLIGEERSRGLSVAVLAVDPSSPFSGGAVLGDRIRMQEHATDPGVFIRSLATRGHMGGVSRSAQHLVTLLDAAGFDLIFVETVGVGQEEVQIRDIAQTVVYVTVPGLGDGVQALKAGVLEIADIYLVNKADIPSSERAASDLQGMLLLDDRKSAWTPPVLSSVATEGLGIPELMESLDQHFAHMDLSGGLDRWRTSVARSSIVNSVNGIVEEGICDLLSADSPDFKSDIEKVSRREKDPHSVAREWLRKFDLSRG